MHGDELFEPQPWDLARAVTVDCEPCVELEALADAMLMWADDEASEQLTREVVDAIWSTAVERQVCEGMTRAAELGDEWRDAAVRALAAFEQSPRRSEVTLAAVQQLAWEIGQEGAPPLFCLCCIDEAIARAPADDRRRHAVEVALLTIRDAAIPEHEVAAALAASAPGRLATDDRRLAVRRRLGRLGHCGRNSLSALAAELERIGAEPLPVDPADDDVWEVVAYAVLAELAQPALN
jgi:hypothetical protein